LRGKPISFSELANPIPCTRPNKNTSKILQGFSFVKSMFSNATNKMESAIIGSTTALGATIIFFILKASVMECATVNAVACQSIVLILLLKKHSPITNKI